MSHAHISALVSLALLVGCTSDNAASTGTASQDAGSSSPAYDPLQGTYPQIMWMCNVYEVPAGTEIGADGTVRATTKVKPNGVGVVGASNVTRAMDSIRSLPNAKHLGVPVCFSPPMATARIEPGSEDKAGTSIGNRTVTMTGVLSGDSVRTSAEIATTSGAASTSCNCGSRDVPKDGALLFLCAGSSVNEPWTLLMVRPAILRSVDDFPFQRESSFSTEK
jgi:hypothetical protein